MPTIHTRIENGEIRLVVDNVEQRRRDERIPVLNEFNPEIEANRYLGEAFRIANGTSDAQPKREHLAELLCYSRAWVEASRGDPIELKALHARIAHLSARNAELEANATAARLGERTVRRIARRPQTGGEAA